MKKSRWRLSSEREPKVGRLILGWYPKGVGMIVVERVGNGKYYDDTGGEWGPPPLWLKVAPLPSVVAERLEKEAKEQ